MERNLTFQLLTLVHILSGKLQGAVRNIIKTPWKFAGDEHTLKERCQIFLTDLLKEAGKQYPANKYVFQGMKVLNPKLVLSKM